MKYFSLKEMTRSNTADVRGIDNTPNIDEEVNLISLIENVLDPLREWYGKPIYVNSGFRNKELNNAVGGAKSSQHLKGEAVDISTRGGYAENKKIFDYIKANLPYDQLIDERNMSWIHVSYKESNNRFQVLKL